MFKLRYTILWYVYTCTVLFAMMATPMSNIHLSGRMKAATWWHSKPGFAICQWRNISDNEKNGWRWKPSHIHKMTNICLSCNSHLISKYNSINITCHWKVKGSSKWSNHQRRKIIYTSFFIDGDKTCNNPCKECFPKIYDW